MGFGMEGETLFHVALAAPAPRGSGMNLPAGCCSVSEHHHARKQE
jgi:hypothetical protein